MDNFLENIFMAALYIYMTIAGFAALYFNYLYAVENGFIAWVFFGEIIATFKGLLWPFFI